MKCEICKTNPGTEEKNGMLLCKGCLENKMILPGIPSNEIFKKENDHGNTNASNTQTEFGFQC